MFKSLLVGWPRNGLMFEFDPDGMTVSDPDTGLRSARLRVTNTHKVTAKNVALKVERIAADRHAPREAHEAAKEFSQHPLRRTRDFPNRHTDSFSLDFEASEEVLFCFWKQEDPEKVYISAPWSAYQHGECFLPRATYTVTVIATAEGFRPFRRILTITPAPEWGFTLKAEPTIQVAY